MGDINWLQLGIGFVGGSFVATLLKIAYDHWRERKQPISYKIERNRIFSSTPDNAALYAEAQVKHEGQTYNFSDLAMLRVDIKNRGNADIPTFICGVELSNNHQILFVDCEGKDRHHHIAEVSDKATPGSPRSAVDIRCEPFNRKDEYAIRLYVKNHGSIEDNHIAISTASPVRFTRQTQLDDSRPLIVQLLSTTSTLFTVMLFAATIALTASFLSPWRERQRANDERIHEMRGMLERLPKLPEGSSQQETAKAMNEWVEVVRDEFRRLDQGDDKK